MDNLIDLLNYVVKSTPPTKIIKTLKTNRKYVNLNYLSDLILDTLVDNYSGLEIKNITESHLRNPKKSLLSGIVDLILLSPEWISYSTWLNSVEKKMRP